MSGGKGGSSTSSVSVPGYIEDAGKRGIGLAEQVADVGYVPYYGLDVAAFTPQQEAAFQGVNDLSAAFGMPTGDFSMPETRMRGGIEGYSSGNLFDAAVKQLRQRRPEIYDALMMGYQNPEQPGRMQQQGQAVPQYNTGMGRSLAEAFGGFF